ncbi:4-hydroxybenzoate 3-monooxygenase [Streptomyces sp. ITFR-16]|uniref:4-hydroxybenzoate 3-monooxygenase n=1 Tax=Streptomyces sp. ITFR-16 TaxID=3075198 RepID=UPI00288BA2BF|nr:4-hydroxybenzoate 3-monooxygenase [Streptomyces sp. ITFR-16]WNI20821.1 4-hydroxybenzoate 3-monooxygenase [Streptomyces sp. ITFR-16]
MTDTGKDTTVAIVGGGVAGLALANFLLRKGIGCIVLEKHSRAYVEQRQRAGALDAGGVRLLNEWGVGEVVEGGYSHGDSDAPMPLLMDGAKRQWRTGGDDEDDIDGTFCPQQVLVRNLIRIFLRDGGDLRFGARNVTLHDVDSGQPVVRYQDADGTAHAVACDFVAGADGYHGVSRTAVPEDVLTCSTHEFGYAWLSAMTEAPADPLAVLAVHSRGFAAQITRGPNASRLYLQCPLTDTVDVWSDERIWDELEARFGEPVEPKGPITSKQVVPLRGVVFSPMSHGRLYLLGDAAHLISPMSAQGMSLALHDADALARAVIRQAEENDPALLDSYSDTCLNHTWERQASAVWMTQTMHDSGDARYEGEFRKQIARKNLETMLEPPTAPHPAA